MAVSVVAAIAVAMVLAGVSFLELFLCGFPYIDDLACEDPALRTRLRKRRDGREQEDPKDNQGSSGLS